MPPKRFEYEIPLIQSSTSSKILIPVTMKDSTYLFLWDTGSETSMILKNQAKLRNIPIEMLAKKGTDTVTHVREILFVDTEVAAMDYAKIGSFQIPPQEIRINQFSKLKDRHKPEIVGLIGQDIISTLHWKFDFQKKIIKISNLEFPEEKSEEKSFILPIVNVVKNSKIPFFKLKFGKELEDDFLFDTGMADGIIINSIDTFSVNPALVINKNKNNFEFISKRTIDLQDQSKKKIHKKFKTLDTLIINNHVFKDFVISEEHLMDFNFCTFRFVEMFSKMYYNPEEKRVTFVPKQAAYK